MEADQATKNPNRSLLALAFAVPIAILGGLIGLGHMSDTKAVGA